MVSQRCDQIKGIQYTHVTLGAAKILAVKVRETLYDSVEALQADLGIWLHHYNTERPHLGFETKSEGPSKPSICLLAKMVKKSRYSKGRLQMGTIR